MDFKRTLEYSIEHGEYFVDDKVGDEDRPIAASAVRYIAFYLPQYHQIPENDLWWGRGFSEWTNVSKALPKFPGHYQPHLPYGLGFYDLKNLDILRQQAKLARSYGITGFCFHHYWFSGKQLLEYPLNALLVNKDIDVGFCINWANHDWTRTWDDKGGEKLIRQEYKANDNQLFAQSILKYVDDERYLRIGKRPILMIYKPADIPNVRRAVEIIREVLVAAGQGDPFIVMPLAFGKEDPRKYGMDGAVEFPPHKFGWGHKEVRDVGAFDKGFRGTVFQYDDMVAESTRKRDYPFTVFKGVCPCWDNDARRPGRGLTYVGTTPEKYGKWLEQASRQTIVTNAAEERVVFINAWNEWAEGAHLEPDRHYGYAFLAETRKVVEALSSNDEAAVYSNVESLSVKAKIYERMYHLRRRVLGT